jgi:hypothetical protein
MALRGRSQVNSISDQQHGRSKISGSLGIFGVVADIGT